MKKILVLCKDNPRELNLCIKGLLHRTKHPFHIVVVDNNSKTDAMKNLLTEFSKNNKIDIVRNKKNFWIMGLNPALKKYITPDDQYFVVTDSDIIVPIPINNQCWLERLTEEMKLNPAIGKLGISLDLGYIKKKVLFKNTYNEEIKHYQRACIGKNFIAPVDTTLAIYRYDYFMMNKPRFYPGHAVLARPYYYCCRTSSDFICKHIGWRSYNKNPNTSLEIKKDKFNCFVLMGAYLDKTFLATMPPIYTMIYRSSRPIIRAMWSINVIKIQLLWTLSKIPFQLNELQYRSR